jgi:hypothetical protein
MREEIRMFMSAASTFDGWIESHPYRSSHFIQSRSGRQRTVALVALAMPWRDVRPFHFLNFTQSHPLHAAGRAMMGYRRATLTSHHKRKFVEKDLFASLTCFHSPARESRPLLRPDAFA